MPDNKALELEGFVQFDFKSRPDYNTWIQAIRSMDEEAQDVMFDFQYRPVTEDGNRTKCRSPFRNNEQ
jgi:hypothetical protein